MVERTLGMARVWKAYFARLQTEPDRVQALLDRVAAYDQALLEVKLEDDDLDKPPPIESKWLPIILTAQAAVVFLVFPPVLVLGSLINAAPYFLTNFISRVASKQYKDTATVKLLAGLVLFPLAWVTAALLVGLGQIELHNSFTGIPRAPWAAGVTTFLIGAFGGALALVYLELVRRTWTSIRIRSEAPVGVDDHPSAIGRASGAVRGDRGNPRGASICPATCSRTDGSGHGTSRSTRTTFP